VNSWKIKTNVCKYMDKNVKIKHVLHDTKIYYSVMYTESKFKNNLYYRNVII